MALARRKCRIGRPVLGSENRGAGRDALVEELIEDPSHLVRLDEEAIMSVI